ncbi:MAG: hypothetical protein RL748_3894 [Pseudomonadota bacterium]
MASKATSSGFPQPKPTWVRDAVLSLHEEFKCSHRKLADTFNRIYFVQTGVSVGRTWVRETIKKHAHERLHLQKKLKHRLPQAHGKNDVWGMDTTCIQDAQGVVHCALGIIDHGSRKILLLRHLKRFNAWTFLGSLFLAVGEYGKPKAIKTDNHAVFHSRRVQRVLRLARIRSAFSTPGKPWQNGRIERFFGTLKAALSGYTILDQNHLRRAMTQFQFWYNVTRPHQHLNGRTPSEAWDGVDPFRAQVKTVHVFVAWGGRLKEMVLRR